MGVQQQSLQRKLIYIGVIIALFTGSWLFRHYLIEAKAADLGVREASVGDVELTGSAVRLLLTGSRGVAVCGLWVIAQDKQKKNQWNELEIITQSLTKLQPHFVTPWLFQSWNLAYNVSVEADRVRDKYYYMTKGIQMAAEGTRRIRFNPELRFYVGFYYQNKIGHHDEKEKLLALFQLSTIDPLERTPERFLPPGSKDVNLIEFKDFASKHSRLVRRLHDLVVDTDNAPKKHERPEDVVRFLADNHDVPSLFLDEKAGAPLAGQKETPKKEERERFPVLPPKHTPPPPLRLYGGSLDELDSTRSLGDDVDPFVVSRSWYCYAQEPVPDPDEIPGSTKDVENRILQHRPKGMSTLLFRNYPPRAQSYIAERLGIEGWLDTKNGWNIVEAFPQLRSLNLSKEEAGVGDKQAVKLAWEKAANMWEFHGRFNHVLLSDQEEKDKRVLAAQYKEAVEIDPSAPAGQHRLRLLQGNLAAAYQAARFIQQYDYYRQLTNFPHFYIQSNVEKQDEAINGRRLFFEADEAKLRPQRHLRLAKYGEGLEVWKDLFKKNPDFRADTAAQEEAYEWELRYLALLQELPDQGQVIKKAMVVEDLLGLLAARPEAAVDRLLTLGELENLQLLPAPYIPGPLDIEDAANKPYIPQSVVETVAGRVAGLAKTAGRQVRPENPVNPPAPPTMAPDTPAPQRVEPR